MTNQTQDQMRTSIAVAQESLRVINNDLKRLRTELPQIIDRNKSEFQKNEIRQHEAGRRGITARIERLENEGSN